MPHLYAYLDDSGKQADHPIIAVSGFVSGFKQWQALYEKWDTLLKSYGVSSLHAVEALRYRRAYGQMKPGTADQRASEILPFIRIITDEIALGVAVAIDTKAYDSARKMYGGALHRKYGSDPHYFAFYNAVAAILDYPQLKGLTIGLSLDDDEQTAMGCYKLLRKLKREATEARERVTSICFSDDRDAPQVQAADLLAHISRLEAQQRFEGKAYPYRGLFEAFEKASPETGAHLHFSGGFYDSNDLATAAAHQATER